MKKHITTPTYIKMKIFVSSIVLLIIASPSSLLASLFIGPTTPSNRFVLATNQVAMISGIYPKYLFDTNEFQTNSEVPQLGASILTATATNSVYMGECKQGLTALAGPLELVVSNTVAITYSIITNSTIKSAVIHPGTTNSIVIPSGKTLHFMAFGIDGGISFPLISDAHLIYGTTEFPGYNIYGGAEFDGPLTIRFIYPALDPSEESFTLPYYITDQAVVLPDQVALQSPTGNFEIQLQKSSDLANWFPSVVLPASGDVKAFYRIEISK